MTEGSTHASRSLPLSTSYIPDGDPGPYGGGTYTNNPTDPTIRDWENIFGPSARDIKDDLQKYKRYGRRHIPEILLGSQPWLTDRIDGLITDATESPFTSVILPYKYFDNVDGKIKWNVWSFDEGMASRVPYEAAARTLTQSKRSYAGYAVRHGLAINLEHNFMMTPKGRENFQNQLRQLIGSIQYSNDLDVHIALLVAPSYEKIQKEKYFGGSDKTSSQICREYVDLFGFMQKNQNALDILIEEAKYRLKTWGGPMPNFMLTNSKLGFQLQMTPERTNYLTQGPDGVKRLKQGPELGSYRGVNIIHTRSFSLENGQEPRDLLRRRVRVAEYYRIPMSRHNSSYEFELYDESRDNWFTLDFTDLIKMARNNHSTNAESRRAFQVLRRLARGFHGPRRARGMGSKLGVQSKDAKTTLGMDHDGDGQAARHHHGHGGDGGRARVIHFVEPIPEAGEDDGFGDGGGGGGGGGDGYGGGGGGGGDGDGDGGGDAPPYADEDEYEQALSRVELVIVRPNIEHYMLGIILGFGGDTLGNTLWGQTELSVYDDSMHGVWGMSYKYHERAIVFNEKNLIRLWDICEFACCSHAVRVPLVCMLFAYR